VRITHPDILETEKFGSLGKNEKIFCFCCGKGLGENKILDVFGRSFCSCICKKTYYER